jgi:sulfite reductase (NADPH) flavoprotein alpha-component
MNPIPFIPENAPFTAEQRHWLNGYLAGFFSHAGGASAVFASAPDAAMEPAKPLLLLYGSQTGTAEGIAKKTAKAAESRGFAPKLLCMEKFEGTDLANQERVLVITSTYGDGDPPDNAQAFWSWLASDTAPRFEQTAFSVLALGDTNYPMFCEFGKKCDTRLEELGAKRVTARVDCDVDYEEAAKGWTEAVLEALGAAGSQAAPTADTTPPAPVVSEPHSRKNPFCARLKTNLKLTREGSEKDVRHFEIALAGSGMSYEVGDALGVMPANCPDHVSELLATLGCDGEEAVPAPDGGEVSLRLALLHHYDITKPSTDLLRSIAEQHADSDVAPLLDSARREDLKKYLWGREVIDLMTGLPKRFSAAELVSALKKLQPRLYSISSSLKAHPEEVHLTVGSVRYHTHGRDRRGVCSTFLADRCSAETAVPVWVQPSHGFKLPADGTRDIIMVGPGTGIAPFRAFLEERRVTGASGRNWLFFGDQRRTCDYLYEETLEAWCADGHLARLDLAFSRDQADKIYVQHRMIEAATDLWSWLEAGAHFYVCGDASRMAKDVDAALHRACEIAGGLTTDAAKEYVAALKTAKRYQRDVY